MLVIDSCVMKFPLEDLQYMAVMYARNALADQIRRATLKVERSSAPAPAKTSSSRPSGMPNPGTKAWGDWANRRNRTDEEIAPYLEEHSRLRTMYEDIDRQAYQELTIVLQDTLDKFKADMRIEWTNELLASEFALGDGTYVTWGAASVEQHEARMKMHSANARAGVEGYARHSKAVDAIKAVNARSLNEAVN